METTTTTPTGPAGDAPGAGLPFVPGASGRSERPADAGGTPPMPSIFVSHGSPMTALQPREAGAFMQRLGPALEAGFGRPRAIVVVSAHSLTREPVVSAAAQHAAIYDFGGFDPALRTLRYDAPGAPWLAPRVEALLEAQGLPVHRVDEGGLDHGAWTPLRFMFPGADVPLLPLAWPPGWPPSRLFGLGRALAPLADEGVLVLASGSITHNLGRIFAGGLDARVDQPATPESTAFRDWWAERTAAGDALALFDHRRQAPHAALMHPTDEHLLPFFVAAGAGSVRPSAPGTGPSRAPDAAGDARADAGIDAPADAGATGGDVVRGLRIHASQTYGDLGMDAYAFGPGAERLDAMLAA